MRSIHYFHISLWISAMCSVSGFSPAIRIMSNPVDYHHLLQGHSSYIVSSLSMASTSTSDSFKSPQSKSQGGPRRTRARDLVYSLIQEENCFTTESGAQAFANACAINVLYEDCYEPQPFVGRMVCFIL